MITTLQVCVAKFRSLRNIPPGTSLCLPPQTDCEWVQKEHTLTIFVNFRSSHKLDYHAKTGPSSPLGRPQNCPSSDIPVAGFCVHTFVYDTFSTFVDFRCRYNHSKRSDAFLQPRTPHTLVAKKIRVTENWIVVLQKIPPTQASLRNKSCYCYCMY